MELLNDKLQSKYEVFFKSLSNFKGSIESFIQQSAQTLASKIKIKTEEGLHISIEGERGTGKIELANRICKLLKANNKIDNDEQFVLDFLKQEKNMVKKLLIIIQKNLHQK